MAQEDELMMHQLEEADVEGDNLKMWYQALADAMGNKSCTKKGHARWTKSSPRAHHHRIFSVGAGHRGTLRIFLRGRESHSTKLSVDASRRR